MTDFLRRASMSLSAYEFQRSYWFGGFLVLVAVVVPESGLADQAKWLADLLKGRWIIFVAVFALIAPILFTALSEFAFWVTRRYGHVDDTAVQRVMPSAPAVRSGEPVPAEARYLLPVEFVSGGFKQVFAAFCTCQFKSHFLGFSPYSVWMRSETGSSTENTRRAIFLARTGDPIDIEKIGRSYRAIRVCDGCWILDRILLKDAPDA